MSRIPSSQRLKEIGYLIVTEMPGVAFVITVFDYSDPTNNHYITNVKDDVAIIALNEDVKKMKENIEGGRS